MITDPSSQARELELELIRVRNAAEAARLEARAAELELMLRRLARGETHAIDGTPYPVPQPATRIDSSDSPVPEPTARSSRQPDRMASIADEDSWSARMANLERRDQPRAIPSSVTYGTPKSPDSAPWPAPADGMSLLEPARPASQPNSLPEIRCNDLFWSPRLPGLSHDSSAAEMLIQQSADQVQASLPASGQAESVSAAESISDSTWLRVDGRAAALPAPHLGEPRQRTEPLDNDEFIPDTTNRKPKDLPSSDPASQPSILEQKLAPNPISASAVTSATEPGLTSERPEAGLDLKSIVSSHSPSAARGTQDAPSLARLAQVATQADEDEPPKRVFRPASWMVSTLAHAAILVLLGFMTLASSPPKDQLAFTASASAASEETVETFEIEESQPQESTAVASDVAYDVSDVGEMAIAEVSVDLPPAFDAPLTTDLLSSSSSSLSSSMMKSLKSDTPSSMKFCGVDGGGSHFVYLVDSSGSMTREGFESARSELLSSIDQLKPDQRFYVLFFDEEPEFMRLTNPNENEPSSVMATPENKQKLRNWAMKVEMNKGKHPTELLPFALGLRPDVIFLLSDGEFPASVATKLQELNREENLFGESRPISIVHTIRYFGREGEEGRKAEAQMIQLAKENGGQYRHVPKPKR